MVDHFAGRVLFVTVFYLIIHLHDTILHEPKTKLFQKCEVDDNRCLANSFTNTLQNWNEYSEIPKLDPYASSHPFILDETHFTSFFSSKLHWWNITICGLKNTVFKEIRGLQPNQSNLEFYMKIYVPKLKLMFNTETNIKIYSTHIHSNGKGIKILENLEIKAYLKANIEQRNGKDYLAIRDIFKGSNPLTDCSYSKTEYQFPNIAPTINYMINRVHDVHWRTIQDMSTPIRDKFVADLIKSILEWTIHKIPIQNMFYKKGTNT